MSLLDTLADEIKALVAPAVTAATYPDELAKLLAQIGAQNNGDPALPAALTAVANFAQQCDALSDGVDPSFEAIANLLEVSGQVISAISALVDAGGPVDGLTNLGEDLAEFLIGRWLALRHPLLNDIGVLLALVEPAWEQTATGARVSGDKLVRRDFRIKRLHADRLVGLIKDPVGTLRGAYANPLATDDDAAALADKLFPRLYHLLNSLGISSRYGINDDDAPALGDWAPRMAHAFIIYVDDALAGAPTSAGLVVHVSPANRGGLGLVFSPFGSLSFARNFGRWAVAMQASANVDAIAWGSHGPSIAASAGVTELDASISASLTPPKGGGPAVVFGSATGTRLELGGVTFRGETQLSLAASSVAINADVTKSKLVIAGGGDSFVSSLLPDKGLEANFDLGIGWSSNKGLTLRGSAGLEADFPVSLSVGGVTLSHLHLALKASDAGIDSEISGVLSASIGPVQATVDRIGLGAHLTFPDKGGNLGGANLAVGFKPPNGVGIAVDMQGLTGGGFLTHDEASGNYGGVLQLSLHETITLTGYGIIGTKMPDGSAGYSLLIFITAEDFGGIQLGFGLTLQSIGGMVGIHRTFDLEVIRSGLKSDSLSTLLFPRDPVANAPALLQALAATFPARKNSYIFGLLARITWFTPTIVQADLALILEVGARSRLLVLGRVSALLPTRDNDLVRLILDADGVLDFNASTFEADAVLVDSRIAHQFPVTGSAALRARWGGGSPNFVLAAGGLNPHFPPPDGFPKLERVAIALCSGNNPRLICDAYLAVTANTVQFGSRVSLYAEAIGFSITGDLGFDALVTLEPPHFLIDFHASVQLKRGSTNLFKVTVDGNLEGPLPLRLHAKATFEILWWDFSVSFDFTLADGGGARISPPAVALEAKVMAALADPANWTAQREANLASGVALRTLPPGSGIVLDPLGQFTVKQQVAPLNTQRAVNTFGGATVSGAQRFAFVAQFGNQAGTPVSGDFAPARYFAMSDDDKLAAPSFDRMDAGVALGSASVSIDPAGIVPALLDYDEFVLNPLPGSLAAPAVPPPLPKSTSFKLQVDSLKPQRATGAAARAPVRSVGAARFRNTVDKPMATMLSPGWRTAPAVGTPPLAARPPATPATNWSESKASLAALDAGGERWVAVPAHELLI